MPYDENLAERIRRVVAGRHGVTEKRMFGGLAFLLDGKMFCGIANSDLMVRVGPERYEAALSLPHVRPMDFTGRPMTGYVYVGPEGSG
ncbi:TfoX/Sxy family protein, partial [Candidatus Poribacteria bacterium]|nr:TfoX/Sxy family protein [Candidatus Poribacteria bacterium]